MMSAPGCSSRAYPGHKRPTNNTILLIPPVSARDVGETGKGVKQRKQNNYRRFVFVPKANNKKKPEEEDNYQVRWSFGYAWSPRSAG